ncbi:hypothetical protein [Polaribacter cellanae]|uniref:Uncharacterized protein n=1 Tax=Polaribacter cellanae TaxID=2818493 RepID=A0A975H5U7_9FLAO|nr:hypothetical protein [Polaribacter cellanae]QTE21781.1 hypothetical protein J3359_13280 [Polaribacter cellanae]
MIKNENQEHSFYIYKSYTEDINKKKLRTKNILLEEEEISNGLNHILDNEGDIVYAEKIKNGKKDENILFKKEFKKKKTKDSYQSRMMENCYPVTTYHYVDNYLVWKINGEPDQWVFAGSTLTGISVSQLCESYWLPDLNIGGGGNSGGYYTNPGNSPAYQDCQSNSNKNYQGRYVEEDNPCKYVITVNPIECGEGYEYDSILGECVEEIVVVSPDDPIENLEKFLGCLDKTKGATVTIYAKQPNPNKPSTPATLENGVGHAFITISQGEHRLSYGFYPEKGIGYFNATAGIMDRNENYPYHVSVTKTISSSTLSNLIKVSLDYDTAEYELQAQNCTNFAISASRIIGLNITESVCIGNYGVGKGATPGKFGAYLKIMNLPTGATRNKAGGISPSNKECLK